MSTFSQAAATSSSVSAIVYGSNVTSGNLLVAAYYNTTAPTGVSDTRGSTWSHATLGSNATFICWAIAAGSGANTVTFTGASGSNNSLVCAEYSTSGLSVVNTAVETLAASQTAVSCGPVLTSTGIVGIILHFEKANSYASSSGSTSRNISNSNRAGIFDNMSASGSYTEAGTISGAMNFGGNVFLLSIGTSSGVGHLLGTMGVGS